MVDGQAFFRICASKSRKGREGPDLGCSFSEDSAEEWLGVDKAKAHTEDYIGGAHAFVC